MALNKIMGEGRATKNATRVEYSESRQKSLKSKSPDPSPELRPETRH
jgi:hypothetical protein